MIIGIDPGQRTGVAVYRDGALIELRTVSPDQIAGVLEELAPELVVFEDSRKQSAVFIRGTNARSMLKIARNVGEVDRLCRQIEALCDRMRIACVGVSPLRKGSKLSAARFCDVTGWSGRSNQHERDAAMCAFRYLGRP